MARSEAWRVGIDHGGTRNKGEKDNSEKDYFDEG
jgi:hypothetical protein